MSVAAHGHCVSVCLCVCLCVAAKGVSVLQRGEDDEAVNFFCDLLPRIRQRYPDLAPHIVEFIQEPGQTVFVPGGWWHGVLNLTHTVAVTQVRCPRSAVRVTPLLK